MVLLSYAEYLNQNVEIWKKSTSCFFVHSTDKNYQKFVKTCRRKKYCGLTALNEVADGVVLLFAGDNDEFNFVHDWQNNSDAQIEVKIVKRKLPKLCFDRILIENLNPTTTEEILELYIESFYEQPKRLVKCQQEGCFVAFFEEKTDSGVELVLEKARADALEGQRIRAEQIFPTNCLLISDIPSSALKREIGRCLMKYKQRNLNITNVEKISESSAVVHFMQCSDAECIFKDYENKKWSPKCAGKTVQLSLFYDRFHSCPEMQLAQQIPRNLEEADAQIHEPPTQNVSDELDTKHDDQEDLMKYLIKDGCNIVQFFGKTELLSNLRRILLVLGISTEIRIIQKNLKVFVHVNIGDNEEKNVGIKLDQFFGHYTSKFVDLNRIRIPWLGSGGKTEIADGGRNETVLTVHILFKNDGVVVTGTANDVNRVVEKLNTELEKHNQGWCIPPTNFRLIHSLGIVGDIMREFEDSVVITSDSGSCTLKFQGPSQKIYEAKHQIAMKFLLTNSEHQTIPEEVVSSRIQPRMQEPLHNPHRNMHQHNYQEKYSFSTRNGIQISIGFGNIAMQDTDAIVNAANEWLENGSGVTGAIFKQGGFEFDRACQQTIEKRYNRRVQTGEAVTTGATGNLKCKVVIHLVGPQWTIHGHNCGSLLFKGIKSVLRLADQTNSKTLALPPVSTGIYGVPITVFVKQFKACLRDLEQKRDGTLEHIRILSIDKQTVQRLVDGFKGNTASGNGGGSTLPPSRYPSSPTSDSPPYTSSGGASSQFYNQGSNALPRHHQRSYNNHRY